VEFSDRPQTVSIISDFSRDPPGITASSRRTTREGWAGAGTTVGNGNVNGDNVNGDNVNGDNVNGDNVNGDIVNGDIKTSHYGHGTI